MIFQNTTHFNKVKYISASGGRGRSGWLSITEPEPRSAAAVRGKTAHSSNTKCDFSLKTKPSDGKTAGGLLSKVTQEKPAKVITPVLGFRDGVFL